jgi:hypothetical protein
VLLEQLVDVAAAAAALRLSTRPPVQHRLVPADRSPPDGRSSTTQVIARLIAQLAEHATGDTLVTVDLPGKLMHDLRGRAGPGELVHGLGGRARRRPPGRHRRHGGTSWPARAPAARWWCLVSAAERGPGDLVHGLRCPASWAARAPRRPPGHDRRRGDARSSAAERGPGELVHGLGGRARRRPPGRHRHDGGTTAARAGPPGPVEDQQAVHRRRGGTRSPQPGPVGGRRAVTGCTLARPGARSPVPGELGRPRWSRTTR